MRKLLSNQLVQRAAEFSFGVIRNRFSRSPVVGGAAVVVCMTTYGRRIASVHHALESIARGTQRPRRLILWLDGESDFREATASGRLRRLITRGLEVAIAEPMGPHAKYYPYVRSESSHELPLVTADDDIIYPKDWLEKLASAYASEPDVIHCYRAHEFTIRNGRPAPYASWPPVTVTAPRFSSFLTGVSGVIYPPNFLDHLREMGDRFRSTAAKADDVWLHAQAVEQGFLVSQLSAEPAHFYVVLGTQRTALWRHNTTGDLGDSGNDEQIRQTYSPTALARIAHDND